ncbi:MAG: hypothetical protein QM656_17725, partial [Paracoccaceae bacterium]
MRRIASAVLFGLASAAAPVSATTIVEGPDGSPYLVPFDDQAGGAAPPRTYLPLRALPPRHVATGGSEAYSPAGVRWGWVEDGRICFQPIGSGSDFAALFSEPAMGEPEGG